MLRLSLAVNGRQAIHAKRAARQVPTAMPGTLAVVAVVLTTRTEAEVPVMTRNSADADVIYRELMRQADELVLHVSPPYSTDGERSAYLNGYEAALHDLSRGWLEVSV